MALSQTAICNIALAELGESRITSLTDGSKQAGLCTTFYEVARDYALAMHPWNFAVTRKGNTAARGTAPAWGYEYAYTVPSGALRILEIGQDGHALERTMWEAEIDPDTDERIIVTDVKAPIQLKYIKRITTTAFFTPMFVLAFAKVLKMMLAYPVTGKQEVHSAAKKELVEFMQNTKTVDGQEGYPSEYTPTDFEDVR